MKPPVFVPNWSGEVKRLFEHDMREIWDPTIAPHIYSQYQNLLQFYFSLVDDKQTLDILDVGCAQATLALKLAERGHRVTAVDIRPEFLSYAASRYTNGDISYVAGNLFENPLMVNTFDIIFANQIIEHVLSPEEKIRNLAHRLKLGGRLVMTTPNFHYVRNGLPSFTEFMAQANPTFRENTADGDGHVFAYSKTELLQQFQNAGLAIASSGYFETPFINGHMKLRHLFPRLPLSLMQSLDQLVLKIPFLAQKAAHQVFVIGSANK